MVWEGGCILLLGIRCFRVRAGVMVMRMRRLVGRCRLGRGGIRLGREGGLGLEEELDKDLDGEVGGVVVGLGDLEGGILFRIFG